MSDAPYVLVIDDDRDVLKLVEGHLHKTGCRVVTAQSGEEGIAQALADPPDLIVLDIMLPGMDGRDVVRVLRSDERTAACRIVVSTVLDREDLHNIDADAVLAKPFRRAVFQDAIAGLLTPR